MNFIGRAAARSPNRVIDLIIAIEGFYIPKVYLFGPKCGIRSLEAKMLRTAEELHIRGLPFEDFAELFCVLYRRYDIIPAAYQMFTPDYIMDLYNYWIYKPLTD